MINKFCVNRFCHFNNFMLNLLKYLAESMWYKLSLRQFYYNFYKKGLWDWPRSNVLHVLQTLKSYEYFDWDDGNTDVKYDKKFITSLPGDGGLNRRQQGRPKHFDSSAARPSLARIPHHSLLLPLQEHKDRRYLFASLVNARFSSTFYSANWPH
jgi:hypothetical protein